MLKFSISMKLKYFPHNDLDIKWGLRVTTAGFQSIVPKTVYPPTGHPEGYAFHTEKGRRLKEYQIVYVTKGRGRYSGESFSEIKVEEGTFFMLFPHEWHTYMPDDNTGWEAYWVGFKGNVADQMFLNNFWDRKQPIKYIGFKEEIIDLILKIINLAKEEKTGYQQVVSGITMHILGLLHYFSRNTNFKDADIINKIDKARLLFRENIDQKINPAEIAQTLGIGYSWFRRTFKKYTGFAPTQYHLQLKIQKAKEMLNDRSKTVKEIAISLNFESADYFCTIYKKKTGMTPGEYRGK